MIDSYVAVLKKYAVFSGRTGRSEFWWFALANFIVIFGLALAAALSGSPVSGAPVANASPLAYIFTAAYAVYLVGVILPSIAVQVRRLHDIGRSGWWYLVVFVPIVGPIVIFVWTIQKSQPGDNKWGPEPISKTTAANTIGAG